MPRKKKTDSTDEVVERKPPARAASHRILDLFEGDVSGLDNLLVLDKVSITRPKGVLAVTVQLTQDLEDAAGWPSWLEANRTALLAAMASEKSKEKSEKARSVDVKMRLVRVDGDSQLGIFESRTVRVWKVKAEASPGAGEVRWYVQLAGEWVEDLGDVLFAALGGQVLVECIPLQQPLLKRMTADTLPPEPGDSVIQ